MNKRWIILALGGIALFVWIRRAGASADAPMVLMFDPATGQNYLAPSPDIATLAPSEEAYSGNADTAEAPLWAPPQQPMMSTPMPATQADEYERRLAAFLATVRDFESAGQYNVLYGGGLFTDYAAHPNIRVPFKNPRTGKMDYSTAAGAYQINFPTWTTEIQPALHLPDFTPQSQDIAARWLLEKRTAAAAMLASGDIASAYRAASGKWASLPGSNAQQNAKPLQVALNQFNSYMGA